MADKSGKNPFALGLMLGLLLVLSPYAYAQQQLTIVKAVFGAGDVQRDVTSFVSAKVQGGQVQIDADSQSLGGDPAFGKVKALTVVYTTAVGKFSITVKEHEKLVVPNPKAVLLASANQVSPNANLPVAPSTAVAQTPAQAPAYPTQNVDITTVDGKEYKNVTITKVEPNGITITTDSGIEKIPFTSLSVELQTKYGYDPAKAKAYAAQDAQAQAAMYEATQQELQRQHDATVEQGKADAEKERTSKLEASARVFNVNVVQSLSSGILADDIQQGVPIDLGASDIIFLQGVKGAAEGERVTVKAYRDGTFTYTNTLGASMTVQKWIVVH